MRETRILEFKEKITNTFLKTVSAFSNYDGGILPLHSEPYRAGRMPDEERQHTVCRYTGNCQPGIFQGEIPKGDTGVLPEGGGFPHWPGRTGKYRVGGGTHGRENAPPAFDLCSADKGQPPVR